MKKLYHTREDWLGAAAEEMRSVFFADKQYKLPKKLSFACAPIKGSSRAIGQCWSPENSTDGTTHVYVCPRMDEPLKVLATLLHELVHAAVGNKCGHKGPFVEAIRELGLAGKPTATYCEEGSDLEGQLDAIWKTVGEYPHKAVIFMPKKAKKPSTLVRWDYEEDPDLNIYIARGKSDEYAETLAELGFVQSEMTTPKPSKRHEGRVD